MAKRERKKTGGVKNPDRRNGKRWCRKHDELGRYGHALSGRTKPSGNSVGGIGVRQTPAP